MIVLESLSFEEKKAVEELKMRVENELEPEMLEDPTLYYRFLKARDFNVDKAEKMLRKNIIWRRAKQINTILQDFVPKEVFLKYLQPGCLGCNKNGDLVVYMAMGKIEGKDALRCFLLNDYINHWIWHGEKIIAKIKMLSEKETNVEGRYSQICLIIDLDELTFGNATWKTSIDIVLRLMHTLQDNYPEGLSSLYVINAPRYYVFAFSIMKSVMSNEMIQKISVFGHDGWKDTFLKNIDADILPVFLGGNRTDPDGNPLCKTILNHAGKLPACYYLSDNERYFKDRDEIRTIFIPKSGQKEIHVDVEKAGSVIQWEFLVKSKDIGVGLFHGEEEVTEILPVFRYETLDGTEKVSYKTKLAGKYILLFDNSYSWMSAKEVEYTIKVLNPTL